MYKQSLYEVIEPIKISTIKRLNRSKKWKYGYNKENDVVVISKSGQIGDVYSIQGLKIALPKATNVDNTNNRWVAHEYPKELKSVKSIFDLTLQNTNHLYNNFGCFFLYHADYTIF